MTAASLADDGRWLALIGLVLIIPTIWRQFRDHNS